MQNTTIMLILFLSLSFCKVNIKYPCVHKTSTFFCFIKEKKTFAKTKLSSILLMLLSAHCKSLIHSWLLMLSTELQIIFCKVVFVFFVENHNHEDSTFKGIYFMHYCNNHLFGMSLLFNFYDLGTNEKFVFT